MMIMMNCQFDWWRKPEHPEETTDLRQVTDDTFTHVLYGPCPVPVYWTGPIYWTGARTGHRPRFGSLIGYCPSTKKLVQPYGLHAPIQTSTLKTKNIRVWLREALRFNEVS